MAAKLQRDGGIIFSTALNNILVDGGSFCSILFT